ncbi:MAG TPA: hypothetical protein PK230_06965 [Chitinophagales bacterium]|nr:hypothetical protein [Chitinophagales bacterium]
MLSFSIEAKVWNNSLFLSAFVSLIIWDKRHQLQHLKITKYLINLAIVISY